MVLFFGRNPNAFCYPPFWLYFLKIDFFLIAAGRQVTLDRGTTRIAASGNFIIKRRNIKSSKRNQESHDAITIENIPEKIRRIKDGKNLPSCAVRICLDSVVNVPFKSAAIFKILC